MSHLNGILQRIIKGDEYRNLDQHGKTSAHGVDLPPLIKKHHLLLEPCLVVLVRLFQPAHLRLYLLHFLHRFEADLGQREKDDLDEDTEDEDIDPEVLRDRMGEFQEPK